jgi:hypothetical protein
MKHPMIGSSIVSHVEEILADTAEPDSRLKPLYAIVTGMGRGKTRTLVEIDLEFKRNHHDVLCVPITFNHIWSVISRDYSSNNAINYAFAIVSRIISMYYRIPLEVVKNCIEEVLENYGIKGYDVGRIIKDCIVYMVRRERVCNKRTINRFILLVDESMRTEEVLRVDDVHEYLRRALLNQQLMHKDEQPLAVDLVMSALNVSATGVSDSGRKIIPISPSLSLDPEEVLQHWVKIHIPDLEFATDVDKLKFLSLITVLSPIPRAIQYMVSELEKCMKHDANSSLVSIDSDLISSLYNNTVTEIDESYPKMLSTILSPLLFKALVFNEEIIVNDEVMDAIKRSKLTNTITDMRPYRTATIVPTASIVSMSRLAESKNYYPAVIDIAMNNLLRFFTDPTKQSGVSLEVILNAVVDARLAVLVDLAKDSKEASEELKSLLQLNNAKGFNRNVVRILNNVRIVVNSAECDNVMIPRSNDKNNGKKYPGQLKPTVIPANLLYLPAV